MFHNVRVLGCGAGGWELTSHYVPQEESQPTVMAKNIGTLAILSENATLLSEFFFCRCKCFGTHMFISLVCVGTTHKKTEDISQI